MSLTNIINSPARQVFSQQWDNFAIQQLFDGNEEVAWEMFKNVWNLAIEEAYNVVQVSSPESAKLIHKLSQK
jgi:hypothetical protein